MLTVVASYRQNVHAYPQRRRRLRGRDHQPRAAFGLVVASALLVDYVLTVAVSISSGVREPGVGPALLLDGPHKVVTTLVIVADRPA